MDALDVSAAHAERNIERRPQRKHDIKTGSGRFRYAVSGPLEQKQQQCQ